MKGRFPVFVGLVITLVLVGYMFMFQVRYDQVAVLTTFDRAVAPEAGDEGSARGSLRTEPGLYARWPWPIQKVHRYSTRLQLHEHRLEQVSTADGKSVIARAFVVWRVDRSDPLSFFVKLQDVESAEQKLSPLLSEQVSGAIGRYRMDELVNVDPDRVKLTEIEAEVLRGLRGQLDRLSYGIEVMEVGIRRLVLPQESTGKVFEAMRKTRERLAASARSSGTAQALSIKSEADAAKKRILAFAQRRAQAIRAQGDKEAASYYSAFREDEALAIFLRRIETLKKILPHNATFILDSDQLSLDGLFGGGVGDDGDAEGEPLPEAGADAGPVDAEPVADGSSAGVVGEPLP